MCPQLICIIGFGRLEARHAQRREIANITTTNSIVTSYKQGGRPTVQGSS